MYCLPLSFHVAMSACSVRPLHSFPIQIAVHFPYTYPCPLSWLVLLTIQYMGKTNISVQTTKNSNAVLQSQKLQLYRLVHTQTILIHWKCSSFELTLSFPLQHLTVRGCTLTGGGVLSAAAGICIYIHLQTLPSNLGSVCSLQNSMETFKCERHPTCSSNVGEENPDNNYSSSYFLATVVCFGWLLQHQ